MSLQTILTCDMVKGCTQTVTHIDSKGYVYCQHHGQLRERCRQLAKWEIEALSRNEPLRYEQRPQDSLKRGARFEHNRFLDPTYGYHLQVPALCEITRLTRDTVYFRVVATYQDGENTREELVSPMYTARATFEQKDVRRWL